LTKPLLTIFLIGCFNSGYPQKPDLLSVISSLQMDRDTFYTTGLFPSQITWKKGKKAAEDNNIFFTALTLYTLQSIRPYFSSFDQGRIDSIYRKASGAFAHYRNRHGDITYNFYQTYPDTPFPGVKRLSENNKAKLPDDLDDTALVYLIQPTTDSLNRTLKQKMVNEVHKQKKIRSAPRAYRNNLMYRTWFADKMKQDIDLCVNVNVLTFIVEKGIPLDTVDRSVLRAMKQIIVNNGHRSQGDRIAPHYQNTSVILYHIARLLAMASDAELNEIRPKIIRDLVAQLEVTENGMERVILLSSLYRLNEKPAFEIDIAKLKQAMDEFYWFRADLIRGNPLGIKNILRKRDFLIYKYRSEAHCWALVAELEALSKAQSKTINDRHVLWIGSY
jgi:hypothetical protein